MDAPKPSALGKGSGRRASWRWAVGTEPFTDEYEVREKLACSIANLIEVRSRIEAGTFSSPRELASPDTNWSRVSNSCA